MAKKSKRKKLPLCRPKRKKRCKGVKRVTRISSYKGKRCHSR